MKIEKLKVGLYLISDVTKNEFYIMTTPGIRTGLGDVILVTKLTSGGSHLILVVQITGNSHDLFIHEMKKISEKELEIFIELIKQIRDFDYKKSLDCNNCVYCDPKEAEQEKGDMHICKLYKKQLLHGNSHPNLRPLDECLFLERKE